MTMRILPRPLRKYMGSGVLIALFGQGMSSWGDQPEIGHILLVAGACTMVAGVFWSFYRLRLGISPRATVDLFWLQRICPQCTELQELLADPKRIITWAEAYAAERTCNKAAKRDAT